MASFSLKVQRCLFTELTKNVPFAGAFLWSGVLTLNSVKELAFSWLISVNAKVFIRKVLAADNVSHLDWKATDYA